MKTKMQKLNSRMMIGLVFILMVMFVPAGRAGVLDDFEVTYYHTDHLGNVLAMTDEAGEKVWPADGDPGTDSHGLKVYEPFGPTDESTGSWESGPIFVFTGKEIDRIEAGGNHLNINDFGARHHLPETAAFMSPDPVEGDFSNPLSWNRYAFCLNNPVNFVDPDGQDSYRLNRQLNPQSLPVRKPVEHIKSHTFIYTTNPNGSLKDTCSWGNEYARNNKGKDVGLWLKNRPEDRSAALEAISQKRAYENATWNEKLFLPDNFGEKIGDSELDPFIEQEFNKRAQYPLDHKEMHEWKLLNNCKTDATKLENDAKAALKNHQQAQGNP